MIRLFNGCINKCIDMLGFCRFFELRFLILVFFERSDWVREKERGVEKECMCSSSSIRSVDLEFGEDLVNMVDIFIVVINFFYFRMWL